MHGMNFQETILADQRRAVWSNGLSVTMLRSGAGSLAIAVSGRVLVLLLAVALAQLLGPDGYGAYAFVLSAITLLAIPVQMGLPNLVARLVALYEHSRQWALLAGILRWANLVVLLLSTLVLVVGIWAGARFDLLPSGVDRASMAWGAVLLPLWGLAAIRANALRGLGRIATGQLPESLVQPFILVVLLATAVFAADITVDVTLTMQLTVAAAAVAFLTGAALLQHVLPSGAKEVRPGFLGWEWSQAAVPYFMAFGAHLLLRNTDIIMLGFMTTTERVGIYRAASQMAALTAFVTTIVQPMVAPYITRAHVTRDVASLQQIVTLGSWVAILGALPAALVFVTIGEWLLSNLFGVEYAAGHSALLILTGSHLIYALMTVSAPLLGMTGHAWQAAFAITLAALVNVLLNWLLVSRMGIDGAALATFLSVVLMQIFMAFFAYRSTRVIVPGLWLQVPIFRHSTNNETKHGRT